MIDSLSLLNTDYPYLETDWETLQNRKYRVKHFQSKRSKEQTFESSSRYAENTVTKIHNYTVSK